MQKPEFRRHDTPDERLARFAGFHAEQALREWEQSDRYNVPVNISDPKQVELIQHCRDNIDADLAPYSVRRQIEDELADYIDRVSCSQSGTLELRNIIARMRSCRRRAPVGIKPDGSLMFAWDEKCGLVRLCPDEARAETQRIAEKYVPAILAAGKENPMRRVFYGVFTTYNFDPGRLLHGKRHQFDLFKEFMAKPYMAERLKGALVVQEDPLAARGDWNVHLNVIMVIEGEFDYKTARELWGWNVEFDLLPKSIEGLTGAVLELVKYSTMHVGIKSKLKFDEATGEVQRDQAPPMTDWPYDRWIEWWHAQRPTAESGRGFTTFRRTRSYGCLYKVKAPEEKMDMNSVIWVGQIEYGSDGWYRATLNKAVDLIPEDNFSRNNRREENLRGFWRGPPDGKGGGGSG